MSNVITDEGLTAVLTFLSGVWFDAVLVRRHAAEVNWKIQARSMQVLSHLIHRDAPLLAIHSGHI
jgi:hypothetical protein